MSQRRIFFKEENKVVQKASRFLASFSKGTYMHFARIHWSNDASYLNLHILITFRWKAYLYKLPHASLEYFHWTEAVHVRSDQKNIVLFKGNFMQWIYLFFLLLQITGSQPWSWNTTCPTPFSVYMLQHSQLIRWLVELGGLRQWKQ